MNNNDPATGLILFLVGLLALLSLATAMVHWVASTFFHV